MKTILLMVMASILWVQVPQWDADKVQNEIYF